MPQIFRFNARARFAIAATMLLALGVMANAQAGQETFKQQQRVARDGAQTAKVIGRTKQTPAPDCPNSARLGECEAIGKTTAIQVRADGRRFPIRALQAGKIVAYAVDVGAPNGDARSFFGDLDAFGSKHFGAASTVRLSVLKRKSDRKFKLKRQSPTVVIGQPAFGNRYYITLEDPLRVTRGLYVGLTVPTWLAALQGRVDATDKIPPGFGKNGNQYIASKPADKCGGDQAFNVHPQQKVDSTRIYACKYLQARVLYRAYYLPKGK
jgi:hypothetical protein